MEKGGFENDELKIKIEKLKKVLQEADAVLIGAEQDFLLQRECYIQVKSLKKIIQIL